MANHMCTPLDFEVRPGHNEVKEYHFHTYWMQNNKEQEGRAKRVAERIVAAVAASRFKVVCPGVTSEHIPGLRRGNRFIPPLGPHPVASFETWVPREYLASFLSFIMFNRDGLSVFIHPLGKISYEDHTDNALWLGQPWPLNSEVLSRKEGDGLENPELGLGYSAKQ